MAELEKREAQRARHEAASADQAEAIADTLRKTVLTFEVQAGPTGTLFGSVTSTNIADEIWRTRKIRVDRRKIALDDSIKRIGRYAIPITVFEGVEVEVKTLVIPEGGELPPEEELAAMEAAEAAEQAAAAEEAGAVADEELVEIADELDETPEAGRNGRGRPPEDESDRIADSAVEQPDEGRSRLGGVGAAAAGGSPSSPASGRVHARLGHRVSLPRANVAQVALGRRSPRDSDRIREGNRSSMTFPPDDDHDGSSRGRS